MNTAKQELVARQDQPVALNDSATVLQVIARAAQDPQCDIEKMERLLQMHERIVAKDAEATFSNSMTACQSAMRPVAADADNPLTRSRYASYAQLDMKLRPIYTKHGFSISYDTAESPKQDHVRVLAYVSCGGYTRTYQVDMPADGKGAKGGDVMTKTHASGAAVSYGMRYLLKMVFNVAVGEDDTDGNDVSSEPRISDEQIANIEALLTEVGADKAKFLRYLKADSVGEILARNYESVVRLIESKRGR